MARTRIRGTLCFCESHFSLHVVSVPDPHSHDAHHRTQIKLNVWHKSQSKAKSRKRRHLVASASMPLGEAMRRQGTDPCEHPHIVSFCNLHGTGRRGTSPVWRSCCTKKVYTAQAPALCVSPYPPAATTIGCAGQRRGQCLFN